MYSAIVCPNTDAHGHRYHAPHQHQCVSQEGAADEYKEASGLSN